MLFERARPVFADIDARTLNLDPAAAAAAVTERTTRAAARAHLRLPGRPARLRGAWACRSSRTPARRWAPSTATACASARAAIRPPSASTPTSSSRRARAGWSRVGDAALKERIDSERNQGRAPDMGWLDHDRLGFNYRLTDIACAIGSVQLDAPGRHARRPRARGRLVPRGAGRHRGPRAAVRGRRRRAPRLVRLRRAGAARARPRRGHPRPAGPRRAVQALPAGHPPHELLPRALRPSRGRVPRLRGRRRAVGRAAVLPGDDRGPGRNGWPRRWRRRSARVHNPGHGEPASRRGARAPPPGAADRRRRLRRRPRRCPSSCGTA